MPSKNAVMYFRAEPRLEKAIKERAAAAEQTPSEFLRELVRAALGLRPDYATNPSVAAETVENNNNLP